MNSLKKHIEVQFNEVENYFEEKTVKSLYEKASELHFIKRLFAAAFFIGGTMLIIILAKYIVNNGTSETIGLMVDSQNSYNQLLPTGWLMWIVAIALYLGLEYIAIKYRKKNTVKMGVYLQYWMYVILALMLYAMIEITFILEINATLRIIFSCLLIISLVFNIYRSIKIAQKMRKQKVGENKIEKLFKKYKLTLIALVPILYLIERYMQHNKDMINPSAQIIKTVLLVAPLFVILLLFFIPWMVKKILQVYLLNIYSEEFRQKFEVPNKEWYGEKSKQYIQAKANGEEE